MKVGKHADALYVYELLKKSLLAMKIRIVHGTFVQCMAKLSVHFQVLVLSWASSRFCAATCDVLVDDGLLLTQAMFHSNFAPSVLFQACCLLIAGCCRMGGMAWPEGQQEQEHLLFYAL